jgi:hypothetical protein
VDLFGRLQNEQRQRRKDEAAAGTTWQLRHFVLIESDPVCESSFLFLVLPFNPPLLSR